MHGAQFDRTLEGVIRQGGVPRRTIDVRCTRADLSACDWRLAGQKRDMLDHAASRASPGPALRWMLRAPGLIYRAGAGPLLGHRFLRLGHRGRRTGRLHRTVLEVVEWRPEVREAIVVSGFGRKAQWFRNVLAGGAAEVEIGRECWLPDARVLSPEEAARVLAGYEGRNRMVRPIVRRVLSGLAGVRYDGTSEARLAVARVLPLIGLRPAEPGHERSEMHQSAHVAVTVAVAPERAFEAFESEMAAWWPAEFTWSQDALEWIGIQDGLCTERGPYGFRIDWGRVLERTPPEHLAFAWQITPARVPEPIPERASRVDVRFAVLPEGGTEVRLEHSGFERHGGGADAYRDAMQREGWPRVLERYAAAVQDRVHGQSTDDGRTT